MDNTDRKRPRPKDENTLSSSPPPYGSKDYWENRYKRFQMEGSENSKEGEGEPDHFHAWYFSYEELAPIILPLILGDARKSDHSVDLAVGSSQTVPHEKADGGGGGAIAGPNVKDHSKSAEKIGGALIDGVVPRPETETSAYEDKAGNGNSSRSGDSSDDDDEFFEVESEDDDGDDEEPPTRSGLAKDGPIEILEVGCGDVPLGKEIIAGIQDLEKAEDTIATEKVLKRVICIDYSANLIEAMRLRDKSDRTVQRSVMLEYECADARKLPFESDRFPFVVEKGTMDAVLSDLETGSDDCRSIVAEMARVVAIGGSIMVISHINAHTENGMEWLNDIVIPGLRQGGGRHQWSVEVHGADVPEDEVEGESPGPAVYLLHKGDLENVPSTSDDPDPPSISLRFLSY